jgi:hypothetical protein
MFVVGVFFAVPTKGLEGGAGGMVIGGGRQAMGPMFSQPTQQPVSFPVGETAISCPALPFFVGSDSVEPFVGSDFEGNLLLGRTLRNLLLGRALRNLLLGRTLRNLLLGRALRNTLLGRTLRNQLLVSFKFVQSAAFAACVFVVPCRMLTRALKVVSVAFPTKRMGERMERHAHTDTDTEERELERGWKKGRQRRG